MKKQKLKISTQSKVIIITIVLALILLCNVLAPYKEYIAGQILFAKDKLIYVKTDEEHSFKPTWNKMELVEKSTTPDDSVCIVSDMTKEQKKEWKINNKYSFKEFSDTDYVNMKFFNHIQRISSNQFLQISYTYKKPFLFAKPVGYRKDKEINEIEDFGENFGSRLTSIKLQIYDINKRKVTNDRELINTRLVSDRYVLLYGAAKEIVISKDRIENKPFFVIPLCSINEEHFIGGPYRRTIDKNGIYDYPSDYTNIYCFYSNRHTNWMDIESLGNLLKQNGVDLKGVMCLYNSIDYNDVNFLIKTESLPQKDAYLYKVYPGLKKYRGKKGKVAKIYLKGLKSSDELVSYFLPEGQNVNYGDGIEIELKDKKKVKINSLEEYFDSIAQEKNDSYEEREVKEENRLSADLFDFK
ncbi:hypothetical protein [Lachnobacterium bovis]|uniref:Uncharacterized protein n=1 Tax=Lachnobacterium bovis TaxID=140626 RepID=A0A1H9UGB7_9FIRM|nr:hypothetical protein [Lachnobacterium bovis]SES08103.1 hypothetical protein SAMN02910429_02085 [Lachnobacterium bovis]